MAARALPARPDLTQLKRQAKELVRRQPQVGRLRDAQRAIAEEYGFALKILSILWNHGAG